MPLGAAGCALRKKGYLPALLCQQASRLTPPEPCAGANAGVDAGGGSAAIGPTGAKGPLRQPVAVSIGESPQPVAVRLAHLRLRACVAWGSCCERRNIALLYRALRRYNLV